MKKFYFAVAGSIVLYAAGFTGYKIYDNYQASKFSDLMLENLEALARGEFPGLLWKKEWVKCPIAGQIILSSDCAGFSAGTYAYSLDLLAQLSSCTYTMTVVEPHEGEKSYCRDGWNFCSKDDCR